MLSPEEIRKLADQYLKGTISDADRERFDAWYAAMPERIEWDDEHTSSISLRNSIYTDVLEKIIREEAPVIPVYKRWLPYVAAAVVLLVLAAGAYLWLRPVADQPVKQEIADTEKIPDVPSGGNRATLTLADGSTLALDALQNGKVTEQGSAIVTKQEALLDYSKAAASKNSAIVYNTLTTPRGGKYQLILPDGSKVWLNAASSLRFPATFNGKTREVEVTGEVFFEIKSDKSKPFIVHAARQRLQVLGTSFNVNAYTDEAMPATTLITGSLKVSAGNDQSLMLNPGQQVVFDAEGAGGLHLKSCNTGDVIAWKDNRFSFTETELPVVLRQLARWYDLDIRYEGGKPTTKFSGTFSRDYTLSEVLRILKVSNVNLILQNKTIIIQP